MSDSNKLVADVRTEFGKGFARRLRAAGKIPAVVYGIMRESGYPRLVGLLSASLVLIGACACLGGGEACARS